MHITSFFWIFLLSSQSLWAFPDTIRHGYVNCTSCHVSPAGGGVLNNYGRSLSKELMSTWGGKNEELPLHGAVEMPEKVMEHFAIGGDARYLSRRTDGPTSKVDEGFWMQAQVKFAAMYKDVKAFVTLGEIENPRESGKVRWTSPEHFLVWSLKEDTHLRFGRFEPIYGLRMPDHNLWIKSEPGFVPWLKREGYEFIYEGENQFASLSGFQTTSDAPAIFQATGYTASLYQIVGENKQVGVSYLNSEGQGTRLRSFSGHARLSFGNHLYSLMEFARVSNSGNAKDVGFARIGYEVFKGFSPILQAQLKIDRENDNGDQNRAGLGFIWLPRPHFEIMLLGEKYHTKTTDSHEGQLLFHYYL